MSERAVLDNAYETLNLLRMCFNNIGGGNSGFILRELVKRHLNTIAGGRDADEPLGAAIKLATKYSLQVDSLTDEVRYLKARLEAIEGELDDGHS